jgi:hypothetical protein
MYNQRYEDIGKVTGVSRIDISDYIRAFLRELANKEGKINLRINNDFDAERIQGLLNIAKNTTFKSIKNLRTGHPYWDHQEVEYVKSNLNRKAYIFYFICSRCTRRVKYLYFYSEIEPPLCRTCCQMPYKPTTYKKRKMSKLLKFNQMSF